MAKAHFCFGASFFFLATFGTLLLTWTCWWIAIVGPSAPARRPYYQSVDVPILVAQASQVSKEPVFVYSLTGGWPSSNSAIRLIASVLAVLCAFSFAVIASVTSQRISKIIFSVFLASTAFFSLIATIMDIVSIAITSKECANQDCKLAVPELVLKSSNSCKCSVDGWYYFTVTSDIILLASASICLALVLSSIFKRRADLP